MFPILFGILVTVSTLANSAKPLHLEWRGSFERNLSAYNLFQDATAQTPNAGLVPFDVATPLFSDYADKHRFVYLQPGTHAEYRPEGPFDLPVGAALVKTFSYPLDARAPEQGHRLIETRLLIHTPDGWKGAAYVWNDAQTDAALKVAGAEIDVSWIDTNGESRGTKYLVPNMNECRMCHRGVTGVVGPLGIKARQFNRGFAYATGASNQLDYWREQEMLEGAPPSAETHAPRWDDATASAESRAFAYLDANCAHCHNPNGLASHTNLDLRYVQDGPAHRGINKRASAAGNASRDRLYAIIAGDPDASFLLHRMRSIKPDVRMPPIGRTLIHEEGAALIAEWIRELAP